MKRGRTIVGEREHVESTSARMQARHKQKRKRVWSVLIASLILLIMIILGVTAWQMWWKKDVAVQAPEVKIAEPTVTIIDEAQTGQITSKIKEFIAYLEQDLKEGGYKIIKATLPKDKSRELYIDLEGRPWYAKVNIDRGAGVTAEDLDRMVRYLDGKQVVPTQYVDVRVEGKAFYK